MLRAKDEAHLAEYEETNRTIMLKILIIEICMAQIANSQFFFFTSEDLLKKPKFNRNVYYSI